MPQSYAHNVVRLGIFLVMLVAIVEATPPGIAYHPSHSHCSNDEIKQCKNLPHVCPKFCPNGCITECRSCKPICIDGSSPPPPYYHPPSITSPKKVKCKNKNYPKCYNQEHTCPSSCPGTCQVDCVSCKPVCSCDKPGAVCQDPRFIGADGITFYFHGKKDKDFCLVSDSEFHINAHFIGKRNENMKRDFTWVQAIGILYGTHKISVGAQKTATWDDAIDRLSLNFDGETIVLPDNEGARVKMGVLMPVMGGDKEFSASGLFDSDCSVTKFQTPKYENEGSLNNLELPTLRCNSGIRGRGVVCKR
ncbi:hypothetical protein RND71_000322 [Anisodus tanguticus]|uniref:Uncharacterized protein n=1 Tax=Anisodus tanguticus TaxID=243964 RepID=A0AAE1VXV4_9SOLA|nr:hypothetical protein RND71_000322 [Anisodus tanguticus]